VGLDYADKHLYENGMYVLGGFVQLRGLWGLLSGITCVFAAEDQFLRSQRG